MFLDEYTNETDLMDLIAKLRGKPIQKSTLWAWQRERGFPRPAKMMGARLYYNPALKEWFKRFFKGQVQAGTVDRFAGA